MHGGGGLFLTVLVYSGLTILGYFKPIESDVFYFQRESSNAPGGGGRSPRAGVRGKSRKLTAMGVRLPLRADLDKFVTVKGINRQPWQIPQSVEHGLLSMEYALTVQTLPSLGAVAAKSA